MKTASLSYAQSLRAIGESLELQGIGSFDLEKQGENYLLRATTIQPAKEASFLEKIGQLLRKSHSDREPLVPATSTQTLCYTSADLSRLVTEQQSRHGRMNVMADAHKLSQVLRVIGDHLDRKEARAFTVSMSGPSVLVAYETESSHQIEENFTIESLYDRTVHMYLRRSKRLGRVA